MDWDTGELRALSADLTKVGPGAAKQASRAIRKAALDVEAHAKTSAQRLFRPPPEGVATGATANSIGVDMTGPLTAVVGPTTHYSVYLEFGTRRMPTPRPFMGPALDAVEPGLVAAIEQIGGEWL